tara:strand:+ start:1351 stop:2040 length:690 start_codon:yes stop_codon:yes gene_type:complete
MDNNKFLSYQLEMFVDLNNKNILPSPILFLTNDVNKVFFFVKRLVSKFIGLKYNSEEDDSIFKNRFDIYLLDLTKSTGIDLIRDLIKFTNLRSLSKNNKYVLINNISYLNHFATNSLLKTLEENIDNCNFILVSSVNDNILDTIKSRCFTFKYFLKKNDIIKSENLDINQCLENYNNEKSNQNYEMVKYALLKHFKENNLINYESLIRKFKILDQSKKFNQNLKNLILY